MYNDGLKNKSDSAELIFQFQRDNILKLKFLQSDDNLIPMFTPPIILQAYSRQEGCFGR